MSRDWKGKPGKVGVNFKPIESVEHCFQHPLTNTRQGLTEDRIWLYSSVTRDSILKGLLEIRDTQRITDPNPEEKYQDLDHFSRDLTELARLGKLDPVIGRDDEIRYGRPTQLEKRLEEMNLKLA